MAKKEKNLPIRIFHKREIDSRETEGGGSGADPKWVLSEEDIREYADDRFYELEIIENELNFDGLGPIEIPKTIGVEIVEDAIAKSHREPIENLFSNSSEQCRSIGFSPTNLMLFPLDREEHLRNAKSIFKNPKENKKAISSIKSIKKYRPIIDEITSFEDDIKVKFIDFKNVNIQKKVEKRFELFCDIKKIHYEKCFYTPELKIYKVNHITKDSLNQMVDIDGILSVCSMPKYEISQEEVEFSEKIPIKQPVAGKEYPVVGVLDSGVANIDYLKPWIIGSYSPYSDDELDKSHGTFVTGVLLYGRQFLKCVENLTDTCNIFDAAVLSDEKFGIVDEKELLDNIREVIALKGDQIKIWNLSLGSTKEAHSEIFSDFAMALDYIQDKEDVIIVKSAGNCTNFELELPVSRISESSDSVRSIVVGSIAHYKFETDLAEVNHWSPFSRVGSGPQGIVKPDLVHYGGNSGLSYDGVRIDNGVPSFDSIGGIVQKVGTSFSTPQVSALLADMDTNLGGHFNSLLLKNLLLHGAKYPTEVEDTIEDKLKKYGYGLAPSTQQLLYNNEHEITLILEDELPKGQFIEILEFPFPQNLVDINGYYDAEIIVTLINKSLLDPSQGREYCQSDLNVALGTFDEVIYRNMSIRTVKNPLGKSNSVNLLTNNPYSKRFDKKKLKSGALEPTLIKGGKFHPTKKYRCDLSQLTPGNKNKYLKAPKKWFLKLEGLYRKRIEDDAKLDGRELSHKFCLTITIRDKTQEKQVYNEVAQQLDQFNFLHQQIELREEIRVTQDIL